jgi:hypothetical protein
LRLDNGCVMVDPSGRPSTSPMTSCAQPGKSLRAKESRARPCLVC